MVACFFSGHRRVYDGNRVLSALEKEIERHITEFGVRAFYVGNHGDFDFMVQCALVKAKAQHPDVLAQVALAYHPAVRPIECPKGLDGTYFPENQEAVPPRYAIVKLNREMVKSVQYLVAYVYAVTDGSYNLLRYAEGRAKRGLLHITNIAKEAEIPTC